jgi:hypothetical protein
MLHGTVYAHAVVFGFYERLMIILEAVRYAANSVQCWVAAAVLVLASTARADVDQKLDLLQVGTQTYTNVTVTTKAPKYIFIMHSGGMANIKISELSEETQEELGYKVKKPSTNNVANWAKAKLATIETTPEVKQLQEKILAQAPAQLVQTQPGQLPKLRLPSTAVLAAIGGVLLLVYLFFCYCSMLIVKKTGNEPGVLVWLPGLQMIPLFKAAGMSGWWFLAAFVPVLNIVSQILWSIRIAQARGKSVWTGIMLLIPGPSLLAFLYLAFSNGGKGEPKETRTRPQLMTLETA